MSKINPHIVIMTDQTGQIRFFNEAAQKITGYSAEEVMGKDAIALLSPPDCQAAARSFVRDCLESVSATRNEHPVMTKVGERRLVSWQYCPLDGEFGCQGTLWIGMDAAERVWAEEMLIRRETFIQHVIDGLNYPFFLVDRQYCYLVYNEAHRQLMKSLFDADIELGGNLLSYHPDPVNRAKAKKNIDRALAGESVTVEAIVGDEQYQTCYVLIEHNPMRDAGGLIIGAAIAAHDISRLRNAEAEVARMQSRYQKLVEEAPAVIMVVSPTGKIEYINSFGSRLFQFAPAELLGRSVEETILPEVESTGRNLWSLYRRIWTGSLPQRECINENLTRQGRRLWLEWSIQPGVSVMTTEEGWLCIGVDVTEKQRSLELERHRLERNRQNEIMQDILSGRLAEKNAAEPLLALGLDLRKPLLCLAVRRVPPDCPDEYSSLRQETDLLLDRCRIVSGGIAWEAADCIGILVSDDAELLPQTGRTEFQQVEELWRKLEQYVLHEVKAVGAAIAASDGESRVARLFSQARSAVSFGPCLHPGRRLFFWQDLGWLRLLVQNVESPDAREFVAEHLSGVLRLPDTEKRELFLSTLRMTMDGLSAEEIAIKMNVHRQTVRYRMSALTRLLGVEGFAGETRINVALALRLHDIQNIRGEAL
ncbi:MAG: PAS domain-containing protein [Veillonellaceae bacterium]|nr:PAS domain-containing protein [Veillonellaceae bacterium]